jgi:hypothetical protein
MRRKVKDEGKDVVENVKIILVNDAVVSPQELNALFLYKERDYTYVKTDNHTHSIYPHPLDN